MAWYDKPTIIKNINKNDHYVFGDESGDIKGLKATIKKRNNGEIIKERDSTFAITTVLISPKCLEALYATFQNIKRNYLPEMSTFHGADINSRKNQYSTANMDDQTYQSFIRELTNEIKKCKYLVQVTHLNKWDYIEKHNITDIKQSSKIIESVYKQHFKNIEAMLLDLNKKAVLVLEESSDKKMDELILRVFVKLRIRKKIVNIKSLYFTRKDADMYPSGTELADIVGQSLFSIFCRPITLIGIKKTYSKNKSKYLNFYEFK